MDGQFVKGFNTPPGGFTFAGLSTAVGIGAAAARVKDEDDEEAGIAVDESLTLAAGLAAATSCYYGRDREG